MQARLADLAGSFGPARVDPGRRGVLAVAVVALLVAGLVGGWVLADRPRPVTTSISAPAAGTVAAGGSLQSPLSSRSPSPSPSASAAGVVVDVAGKVRRPGVYQLRAGARVSDAVAAAGGMVPGVDPVSVNLARKVVDGEQIVVGLTAGSAFAGGLPPAGSSGSAASSNQPSGGVAGAPLNLNTATVDQLDALPGVGPVLAQRIVDWRTQHGRFDSVDQLNSVSGIGDAKFADLKPLVTV